MKNLTRVLALVLTFAMMISTVAMAATFTDIAEDSTYAEATAVLADLGILKGYEDGTFGADKVITRAEVVAVVNRLQGLSDAAKAAGGATQYTDVPSTEWYAGDVNLATQMGIISGDGNGLFRPNDQVKYEEAVKMVVAALGYNQEYVLKRGGWPTGYLVIATEAEISKGMSAGAGDPAYRGIVAKLAYNALTAPTFAFKEYSTDGKAIYAVNEAKITLEEKLQTYKLTGEVVGNATTKLPNGNLTDNDEVDYKIKEDKTGKYVAGWSFPTNPAVGHYEKDTFKVGATDVAGTLGFTTDIYVAENEEGEWEIVSYVINKIKNSAVVIEDTTTISVYGASQYPSVINGTAGDYLSIYDDEVDTTNTTYDLEAGATLIVNGQEQGTMVANRNTTMYNLGGTSVAGSDLGKIYAPAYGTVTLLDNNNNGAYDYVFVESYEVAVVDDVIDTATSKKIYTKNTPVIDLTQHFEGKTGYTYAITLDGEEATLADLQENDVIAVAMTKDKKAYDIVATRKTVAGLVSEADTTGVLADYEFVVDGTAYKVANLDDQTTAGLGTVRVGDEVTFYLDAFNNVAFVEKTSSASKNYGFIVSAGQDTSVGDTTYQVRLLDKEGKIETYALAEKVRFANTNNNGVVQPNIPALTVYNAIKALSVDGNTDWTLYTANNATNIDKYAKRVITYKLNANGDISEVVFAGARNQNGKESYLTYTGAADVKTAQFNAKTGTFINARSVNEDTVVFNLPMTTNVVKEDFKVETVASLTHEDTYDVAFLSVDEDNIAKVMIVVNNAASVTKGSNLAVVKKVMAAQNAEYEDIYNITFIQNGEEKTLATTNEVYGFGMPAVGSVFEYAVNAEGEIKAIGFASDYLTIDEIAGYHFDANVGAVVDNYASNFVFNGGKEQYVYGTVYAKTNSRVVAIGGAQDTHAIPAEANFVLVDLTKAKNNVAVSSYAELREYKLDAGVVIPDNDYTVFMKYFNDEITDVVIYKGANARYGK